MITGQPWNLMTGETLATELIKAGMDSAKESLLAKYNEAQNQLESIQNKPVDENAGLGNQLAVYAQKCGASSASAAMAAVVDGAGNILEYVDQVKSGKLNIQEATSKIIGETLSAAASSAINAAGESGRCILVERFGSEQEAIPALVQQGAKIMLEKANIPGDKKIVDVIQDVVNLGAGKISPAEFGKKCGQFAMECCNGKFSSLGSSAGMGAAQTFINTAPLLSKIGAMKTAIQAASKANVVAIAAIAAAIATKIGVDRQYRHLLSNTQTLRDAAGELERISGQMSKKQILFTKFLEADAQMEETINNSMRRVDAAGQSALDAISKI